MPTQNNRFNARGVSPIGLDFNFMRPNPMQTTQPMNISPPAMQGGIFGGAGNNLGTGAPMQQGFLGRNFNREAMFGEGGWFMPALQGTMAAANTFMGMQNYRLARRSAADQREFAERNWDRQTNLLEEYRQDRQTARNAANPGVYGSTAAPIDSIGSRPSAGASGGTGQPNTSQDFSSLERYQRRRGV